MTGFSRAAARTQLGTISYMERPGSGTPLVLLHGVGGNAGAWLRQAAAFGDCRLIAWDAPGYGGSFDFAAESPALADYAAAFAALLDALKIPKVMLLGHSFGGLVAAAAATLHPTRVSRLLLTACSSGHATHDPEKRESLLRARLTGFTGDAAGYARVRAPKLLSNTAPAGLIEQAVGIMSGLRLPGFHQANRMISGADIFRYLPAVAAPARVICGSADEVAPLEQNRRIAAALPRADLVQIQNAGHWLFLEHAGEFNAAAEDFVLQSR